MNWWEGPLCVLDTETTGVNVREARVVTGYVATVLGAADDRHVMTDAKVLINPGVPIPEEASRVHGVTTERAEAEGCDPIDGINSIVEAAARALKARIPVTMFNGSFDMSILYRECLRYGLPTLAERLGRPPNGMFGPIIDAHVLDKGVDPWRKGSRKLDATAEHYGVPLLDAHTADADALAAGRVAVEIARRYPAVGGADLRQLYVMQRDWRAEQMAGLQRYFREKKGQTDAYCDPCWPCCTDDTHPSG